MIRAKQLRELQAPFEPDRVEWRISRAGEKRDKESGEARLWVRAVPYLKSHTIQERFDEVVGPGNWAVKYKESDHGTLCGIGVQVDLSAWIWKWDGSGFLEPRKGFSDDDAARGNYTNAFKRAGSGPWGVGRYLRHVGEGFADVVDSGRYFGRIQVKRGDREEGVNLWWNPPEIPNQFLPWAGGVDTTTGEMDDEAGVETEATHLAQLTEEYMDLVEELLPDLESMEQARARRAFEMHFPGVPDDSRAWTSDDCRLVLAALKEDGRRELDRAVAFTSGKKR